ncbi:hypothetical protein Y1Q_0006150 [Alligator mississippiensis]|uniref:DDE Tnp4 domain-containing protein n=1 Tax=Alligator mississippiensis TaxID=8496 RepID=A0A151NXY6_ALLMI|nr:hypothetical protein Y1Q_0006150 [Alligator mississippiensis]
MHQATFMDITAQLAPHILHQDTSMQPPFTPEKQEVITILKLATPSTYITNEVSVGKLTAEEAIWEDNIDHQDCFTHIFIGWVGSPHDAYIFHNLPLPQMIENRHYTPMVPSSIIGTVLVPLFIIWYLAYPLMLWLMKPYMGQLDCQKEPFNYCLRRCYITVECTFGHFKTYWQALSMHLKLQDEI